jgi:hypothetical protein
MSQAQRAVIALFACLVIWLAWQSRMSWQHPILPSGEYPHQQSATSATGGENQAQNLNWNNWTRDPVAVFTGLLTLFNGLLFVSTIGLWLATRKSAGISERALVDLERPILQIVEPFQSIAHPLSDEPDAISTSYKIANFGRTPATLHEISIQFGPWNDPPPPPVYEIKFLTAVVIPQGQTIPGKTQKLPPRFDADKRHSFVFGYLRYSDIFGFSHITGFGLRWERDLKSWAISGGVAYNYQRIEREPEKHR